MIEIPEANSLSKQINDCLLGKCIVEVKAASSAHKFAWYHGDPVEYPSRLKGNTIVSSSAAGGMVEITLSNSKLLFSDGVNLRFLGSPEMIPPKNQLLLTFEDNSMLAGSVQMYGGLICWVDGETYDNSYYLAAMEKPSPLSEHFNQDYFLQILSGDEVKKMSLKAALATQQRVPGLGNGVLQDILWKAKLSPRRKINTLSENDLKLLFVCIKEVLEKMTQLGGRDSEKDLFGKPGGYEVIMASKNQDKPCPNCGTLIKKEAYLGGSVYYCENCQKL